MKSRWLSIFLVLALAAVGLTANVALAQTTGDIDGTVTDSNNAPLPGASVTIVSNALQGTRTAVTFPPTNRLVGTKTYCVSRTTIARPE